MPVRAVLFDLGDTLWHFPDFPDDAVVVAALTERVEDQLRSWDLCDGVRCSDLVTATRQVVWDATLAAEGGDGRSPDFPMLVRRTAAQHGVALTPTQARRLWSLWHLGGAFFGRVVFPDSAPTLAELRRRGYRIGAVTNRPHGGQGFVEELRESGLLDSFETLAVSCDDGWLKPNPALFRRAIDDLRVAPEEAAMVGDQLRADVLGAKAIGMVAIWKRPIGWERQEPSAFPDGTPALPDYTIDHPRELLHLPILAGAETVRSSGTTPDRSGG